MTSQSSHLRHNRTRNEPKVSLDSLQHSEDELDQESAAMEIPFDEMSKYPMVIPQPPPTGGFEGIFFGNLDRCFWRGRVLRNYKKHFPNFKMAQEREHRNIPDRNSPSYRPPTNIIASGLSGERPETPAIAERPLVEEAPAIAERPLVEEAPAIAERPLDEEAPAIAERPLDEETPAIAEIPLDEETPATAEIPLDEETPAIAERPLDEEAPAIAEIPLDEETPAIAEIPCVEERPAVLERDEIEIEPRETYIQHGTVPLTGFQTWIMVEDVWYSRYREWVQDFTVCIWEYSEPTGVWDFSDGDLPPGHRGARPYTG